LAFYGFDRYIDYPADLILSAHDLDKVVQTGRVIASRRDLSDSKAWAWPRC
jgi:hypothetical protein